MALIDVISLTQKLISFNTINPPGNELVIAKFVGKLLSENGFDVDYILFGENRLHLVAERGLSDMAQPLVLSGHFDTVPLNAKVWEMDPFAGVITGNKIFGRGSSDMKSGLAAMIDAAISCFNEGIPEGGVRIIFTAGEEQGCQGVVQLTEKYKKFGNARAIIVGEPTANIPAIGHKGALYFNALTTGITAHSSMPELGVNAIYKAARAISKIESINFLVERDPLLGYPTVNVGQIRGGLNLNSVPDHAEFTIDVRTTNKIKHTEIIQRLKDELGEEVKLTTLVNMSPVSTTEEDPFIQMVYKVCNIDRSLGEYSKALPYLTDGSVLQNLYNGAPTVILGPGQPEMAHKTDEFCYLGNIKNAVRIYKNIILNRKN